MALTTLAGQEIPTTVVTERTSPIGIELVLQGLQNESQRGLDRRQDKRFAFPYPIRVTPVQRDENSLIGESFVVIGKHISRRGLDFYFHQPLPFRRLQAALPYRGDQHLNMLLELEWCRFGEHGWYVSVARFINS